MNEHIKEAVTRWSLDRVRFLLAHIEDFIDDEEKELRERARNFNAAGGLDKIQNLAEGDPSSPGRPVFVLERLSSFFEAGLLIQHSDNWWVTDLFWRGNGFHLETKDRVLANKLVPPIAPVQVQRAAAAKTLDALNLRFLAPGSDCDSFIVKPTPAIAYILISRLAAPWSVDHMAQAHRLINKAFIY